MRETDTNRDRIRGRQVQGFENAYNTLHAIQVLKHNSNINLKLN